MQTLNQTKAELFAQRMVDILNSGAIALGIKNEFSFNEVDKQEATDE